MKAIIAGVIVALVLAGGAFATGSALDPRVPGLQRQVRALQSQMAGKVDKACVKIMPVVIRPGYVYQLTNGQLVTYKAFDEYDASIDTSYDPVMVAGC